MPAARPETSTTSTPTAKPVDVSSLRIPAGDRLIAIGDVHGDLAATRAALRLAGVIDEGDHWNGGKTVVVQTGDQLDRGDDEQAILDLLVRLRDEAAASGGALVVLNGNHEIMNALGDFRYVTAPGMRDFDGVVGARLDDARLTAVPEPERARLAAFLPGAPYAEQLAQRHIAVVVGDTVFAHGGIVPEQVGGLAQLDADVRAWLGSGAPADVVGRIMDEQGPVWNRELGGNDEPRMCERLGRTLAALGVKRMVVGHTVQQGGITSACDARVWRIDVGLAHHYGGPTQVLEIRGDDVRVLGAAP